MRRANKRTKLLAVITVAALLLLLAACGKSEFGVTENTAKQMTITAENADKDAYFMVGALEAADGEQIAITSNLTKGTVRVEIIEAPEEQSADKLPEIEGDPVITATLGESMDGNKTETIAGDVKKGNYMVKATCLETATGTLLVEVKPAP